jgi:hypothetical protein
MPDEAQAYKGDVLQVAGLGYGRPGLCKGVSPFCHTFLLRNFFKYAFIAA